MTTVVHIKKRCYRTELNGIAFCYYHARSQVVARAPTAILVHPLLLLCAPTIGTEDLEVEGTVKF